MLTQCVWVAAKLGVADLVVDGPKSCDDLATATDSDATSLCQRVLRCLTSKCRSHRLNVRAVGTTRTLPTRWKIGSSAT